MVILFNNKIINQKQAVLPITSQAVMHGYGVFETLRTYSKEVFKLNEHIDRLLNSAVCIDLEIKYNKEEISDMVKKIVNASEYEEQRLKVMAIEEGIYIISEQLIIDQEVYQGVGIKSVECIRTIPQAKLLSYIDSYVSHQKSVRDGFYDALLIDKNKEVYEGAYSNIFWFENNKLCTRRDAVLLGITRQAIIDISPWQICYKTILLEELKQKQEIFLTQTSTGLVPVIKIDEKIIGNGMPGKQTVKLIKLFKGITKS